ncbi:MAG: BolA/IbaG family iron-sulfur metabolism protein [Proteobacteria bacterium]|nr:BolA/IbaG family iron-sulfur metabolism protein [Pseudomonadota bacterium]
MAVDEKTLYSALEAHFKDAVITLVDTAGDNDHWAASITSSAFQGKSRIMQHRMVQDAVKHLQIHALSITTKTP